MKSKTIVLWGREDLLSSSVELFLTDQKGWKVVNISDEENFDVLIQAVEKVNPDVVIILQGDRACHSNAPMILLQDHPGLKVITLNPKNNVMEVFSKQNILVKSASDLISVIEVASVNASKR